VGMRRIEGGPSNGNGEEPNLRFDGDAVIETLAQQIGLLSAQLAIRESIIETLRGDLAAARSGRPAKEPAPT